MNRKLIFSFFIAGLLVAGLSNCRKQEAPGVPPVPVTGIQAVPGYGEIDFSWDSLALSATDSTHFLYTSISYTDSMGKIHEYKFSRYTHSAVIDGLVSKPYTFTIRTVGPNDAVTNVTSITITPGIPAYLLVAQSLQITASIGGARVSWTNNTGKTIVVTTAYSDSLGNIFHNTFSSPAVNGVGFVSGLPAGAPITISAVVTDASQVRSPSVSATITPQTEVKLSRQGWSVAAFSDQEDVGEGPPNGLAISAIDGNIQTYWHTQWDNEQPSYPHWIVINIGKTATISKIGLVNRQGDDQGQTEIRLMGSMDGSAWTDLGTYPFRQVDPEQDFPVAPQQWQYIKVVLTKGPNFFGFLAEIYLYGAQ